MEVVSLSSANMERDEARQSLETISDAKRLVAERSRAPKGYYAALGGVMALIIFAAAFPPSVSIPLAVVALALTGLSVVWYRKAVPTSAYGKLWDKNSVPFWLMALTVVAALILSFATRNIWVAGVGAVLTWAVWSILGPIWDKGYRRQLEAE